MVRHKPFNVTKLKDNATHEFLNGSSGENDPIELKTILKAVQRNCP